MLIYDKQLKLWHGEHILYEESTGIGMAYRNDRFAVRIDGLLIFNKQAKNRDRTYVNELKQIESILNPRIDFKIKVWCNLKNSYDLNEMRSQLKREAEEKIHSYKKWHEKSYNMNVVLPVLDVVVSSLSEKSPYLQSRLKKLHEIRDNERIYSFIKECA